LHTVPKDLDDAISLTVHTRCRVDKHTSRPLTLNTGSPKCCILSPILYSLYTHDCVARSSSNTIVKFADDTVVVGLISANDDKPYLKEVANLSLWCQDNSLMLNVSKTKELIVDFRRTQHQRTYTPLVCKLMVLLWRG